MTNRKKFSKLVLIVIALDFVSAIPDVTFKTAVLFFQYPRKKKGYFEKRQCFGGGGLKEMTRKQGACRFWEEIQKERATVEKNEVTIC